MERGTGGSVGWEGSFFYLELVGVYTGCLFVNIHWYVSLSFGHFIICNKTSIFNDLCDLTQSSLILSLGASSPNAYLHIYYISCIPSCFPLTVLSVFQPQNFSLTIYFHFYFFFKIST